MAVVELQLPGLPEHVRTARIVAAAMGRRSGLGPELIDEVRLAVGEAAARAVSVTRKHAPDRRVLIRLHDDGETYTVEVADCGPHGIDLPPEQDEGGRTSATDLIDQRSAAEADHEAHSSLPPGVGLALIVGLVDDVDIRSGDDGGTTVVMRWPLTRPGPDEEPDDDIDLDALVRDVESGAWADDPPGTDTGRAAG